MVLQITSQLLITVHVAAEHQHGTALHVSLHVNTEDMSFTASLYIKQVH